MSEGTRTFDLLRCGSLGDISDTLKKRNCGAAYQKISLILGRHFGAKRIVYESISTSPLGGIGSWKGSGGGNRNKVKTRSSELQFC